MQLAARHWATEKVEVVGALESLYKPMTGWGWV